MIQKTDHVLLLGATSGIARALSHLLAQRGARLILAGRDRQELNRLAADLRIRYRAEAQTEIFDALDFASHPGFVARCLERFSGRLNGAVLCYGQLPDQSLTETSFAAARSTLDVNFTSAVSILNPLANYLERRRSGFIAAISSVAGDRGRQSNYTYGAAKAGLTAYLQGLRNRLQRSGVQVLTVKPGFVNTPMTAGLINPSSPLVASPETVARDIARAIDGRRDVLYTPWFWRGIMGIVEMIPERVFKRLRM